MTKGAREPDSGLRCVTVGGPFDASEDASLGVCLCCQKAQKGCSFRAEPSSSWAKKHSWVEVEWDAATQKSRVREGGARHRRSPGVEEAESLEEERRSRTPLFLPDPDDKEESKRKKRKLEKTGEGGKGVGNAKGGEVVRGRGEGSSKGVGLGGRKEKEEEEEAGEEVFEEGLPATLVDLMKGDALSPLVGQERDPEARSFVDVLSALAVNLKKDSKRTLQEAKEAVERARNAQDEFAVVKRLLDFWSSNGKGDMRKVWSVLDELEKE